MIIDHIDNAERWFSLHPLFKEAFSAIRTTLSWPSGRADLGSNGLFTFGGHGHAPGGSTMETHRRHLDIHFTIEGTDHFAWRALADCIAPDGPFDEASDCRLFRDAPASVTPLTKGLFAIVWPEDAHAPLYLPSSFTKVVMKVPIAGT
jgi:biofilm protein TabA